MAGWPAAGPGDAMACGDLINLILRDTLGPARSRSVSSQQQILVQASSSLVKIVIAGTTLSFRAVYVHVLHVAGHILTTQLLEFISWL